MEVVFLGKSALPLTIAKGCMSLSKNTSSGLSCRSATFPTHERISGIPYRVPRTPAWASASGITAAQPRSILTNFRLFSQLVFYLSKNWFE